MTKKFPAPAGMGEEGKAFWNRVVSDESLVLRPDELKLLEQACRTIGMIKRFDEELAGSELLVAGSMGQMVLNPLIAEARQQRAALASLLKALKLPDAEDVVSGASVTDLRSVQARSAGQSRWSKSYGATA